MRSEWSVADAFDCLRYGPERSGRLERVPVARSTYLIGALAGLVGAVALFVLGQGSAIWLLVGPVYGVAATFAFGDRSTGPGRGLMWGLGTGFLAWVLWIGSLQFVVSPTLDYPNAIADFVPQLLRVLLGFAAPVGVSIGAWQAGWVSTGRYNVDLVRALVVGGVAGIVGGWAFSIWMEQAGTLPLVAQLVGATDPEVGRLVHFLIAVVIGVTFGLLFQRDALGHGSSLIWGMAYGMFWWLLGGLTLFPLLLGSTPAWTADAASGQLGSLVGHVVYGLLLGLVYSSLDRTWLVLFHESDPLNRSVTAPGIRTLRAAAWGGLASLTGGLLFGTVMWITGDLLRVAELVGQSSSLVGFIVHMGISAIIGSSYGQLFHYESPDLGSGVAWGLVYGLAWWFVGALTLFPTLLGGSLAWNATYMAAAVPSLIGHLAYGGATGGAFYVLECRQQAWARLDPRIEKQERTRRRHVGTPAPAVWMFTLGIGVFVLLLLI